MNTSGVDVEVDRTSFSDAAILFSFDSLIDLSQSALSAAWRNARNASFNPWLTALSGS